jgi:hypothetical protein
MKCAIIGSGKVGTALVRDALSSILLSELHGAVAGYDGKWK